MNNSNKALDWLKYERGLKYNNSLKPSYYDTVNTNLDFAAGVQWRNVESNGQPTPTFNYIKKTIAVMVSFITSSKVKIKLSPLAYNEDADKQQDPNTMDPQQQQQQVQQHASDIATNEIANLFEKFKMENVIRDACFDAAKMGDVASHMYFDANSKPYNGMLGDQMGEIEFELIDGTNLFLGNANNPIISTKVQPYVLISGRDMIESLKDEAKAFKSKGGEADNVTSDTLTQYQAGEMARIEIEGDEWGKALYIIVYKYDKATKTIKVSKCTENAYMYKDVDTGLSDYPVALFHWEKQKNQYHGRALATGMISNQIFINKMFFMVMQNLMLTAFPVLIYDKSKISGFSNRLGAQIGIDTSTPGDNVRNAAAYMEPGTMSVQITNAIDMAIKYTKECLGLNDTLAGDVNPEQASGAAIALSVKQSSIPLENPKANMYGWTEDIGKILIDMMGTYYQVRPIVADNNGVKSIESFDFGVFKKLWLKVKCDVGPSSYFSEIAQVQMMNNLLNMKDPLFDMITFLENLPDGYIQQPLIDAVKAKQQQLQQMQQQQAMQQQQQVQQQQGDQQQAQQDNNAKYEQMALFLEKLPPDVQRKIKSLPSDQQESTLAKLMQQDINSSMNPK